MTRIVRLFCSSIIVLVLTVPDVLAQRAAVPTDKDRISGDDGRDLARIGCAEDQLAFAGACRDRPFFESMAAPDWKLVSVSGCKVPPNSCSEQILLTEQRIGDRKSRTRTLLIGASTGLPGQGLRTGPVRTVSRANTGAGYRAGYPVRFLQAQTVSASGQETVIETSLRARTKPTGGRKRLRQIDHSTLTIGPPQPTSGSGWMSDARLEFCNESGDWPIAEETGTIMCRADMGQAWPYGPDVDCTYFATVCPSGQENCSAATSPVVHINTGPATANDRGLLCRSGTGAFGFSPPLALGGGDSGMTQCQGYADLLNSAVDTSCSVASWTLSWMVVPVRYFYTLTFTVEAGSGLLFGIETSVDDIVSDYVLGLEDSAKAHQWMRDTICKPSGDMAGYAYRTFAGCSPVAGQCKGTHPMHARMDVTNNRDGSTWRCDVSVDLECKGSGNVGDVTCQCESKPETATFSNCTKSG